LAKNKNIVGGIECSTPSEYLQIRLQQKEDFKAEVKKRNKIRYYSKKPENKSKEITFEEKQTEENEYIAWQRLKTDVHRDYEGNFTWLLFSARRELTYQKSQPLFLSEYGSLFMSTNLPHLLELCWELEIYGHCILYDQKRYDQKTLRKLITHFKEASTHIIEARSLIYDRTYSKKAKEKLNKPEMYAMFGRSQNTGLTFVQSLIHELEKIEFEFDDLIRIARADLKLPKPTKDKEQRKLQYFIYLGEEIFKRISFQYFFPHLDLSNTIIYNRECKNFLVQIAKDLDQIRATDPSTIKNAYDRKKKYKMKYVGLHKAKNFNEFSSLLKQINL
jgi:hypothetical protein